MKLMNFTKRAAQAGFTMIELLVVIAILGILAVVVLGTINPLEQINRGRDTTSRTDAEALITAVERYYANSGRFPWMLSTESPPDRTVTPFTQVTDDTLFEGVDDTSCGVLELLSTGTADGTTCVGTLELKDSMAARLNELDTERALYLYQRGDTSGDNTYVCFSPQSRAFEQQADDDCAAWQGSAGFPSDVDAAIFEAAVCPADDAANAAGELGIPMVCLP